MIDWFEKRWSDIQFVASLPRIWQLLSEFWTFKVISYDHEHQQRAETDADANLKFRPGVRRVFFIIFVFLFLEFL